MQSCIKFRYLRFSSFCEVGAGFFLAVVKRLLSLCNFEFLQG